MSLLERINSFKIPDLRTYLPFKVDGKNVGYVKPWLANELENFPEVFIINSSFLSFNEKIKCYKSRSLAMGEVVESLTKRGIISGWRGEKYRVASSHIAPSLFEIERAAVPIFGTIGYGVHLNGVSMRESGICMWVGKRSLDKPTGPGKLDQMVAGGQPIGITVRENLIKECAEEANIPYKISNRAVPVGAITYCFERPEGLRRDVLFVYDLFVSENFIPQNMDGEIEDFQLMTVDQLIERVSTTDDFKFNCAMVVIDFLIRHGQIGPDQEDYLHLISGLHGLRNSFFCNEK